ncbi:alpha-hydroxy acid oxidase [Fulvivirga sedimenti]|uniref:Alpha-hydroxy-acid oxidizing protein n=1 Tax=Fulvivirga sedimenti TaxID=2879465 RepID=A0A9X1L075_9BACT|nr:alpha-hydroxy acid oxidase [Fulvivirga sedimenti]MCA6074647.1 alpha-hydroxy-acid oxidizing protein [Fulvivirga sedimenti]MCA6075824.1 alpha-hydroxy-acid oxidizing protein [Fulvivirga sedimenti]MCA6076952.1 alpha-hydroxy-acid oxidizing protein [Fulvivirga sedimenti]
MGLSSLALALPYVGCDIKDRPVLLEEIQEADLALLKNIFDLEKLSGEAMGEDALSYLNGGADDLKTVRANHEAYGNIQIRPRRLVDVRNISTKIELFGKELDNPIILCPVGFQKVFHPDGEIASAKAAVNRNHQMIVSSVSNFSVNEIAKESGADLWFQLYPTSDRAITKKLLDRAMAAGCKVCFLTVDTPVLGNRENHGTNLAKMIESGEIEMGNFRDILPEGMGINDPGMTWEMIGWLRENCDMKIVLKGIVTREDARLAVQHNVDGIVVSNHGGRQLESNRATIDCLPEVAEEVNGAFPVLIDGGIRRGTDIFKALALGASAVCIGRPFCWGLGALGQQGVELALEILKTELIRDMQLAGTPSVSDITSNYVLRS